MGVSYCEEVTIKLENARQLGSKHGVTPRKLMTTGGHITRKNECKEVTEAGLPGVVRDVQEWNTMGSCF